MDQFYLNNVARYHKLVGALDPTPKPRIATGTSNPNMIVSARIRPLSTDEKFPCAIYPRSIQRNVADIHNLYNHPSGFPILKSFDYHLDRLFNSESTTDEIYEDLVADLVPFAWNGGIGTLFAYGQTGSGKTFTVSGLERLVAETLTDGSLEGDREIHMTIIDLAGNAAFDLLNERESVRLLEDSQGVTQIVGAKEHQVHGKQDMVDLIERAASFRRTAPTLKNDASSRSHAICRIRIRNRAADSDGLLYLIDLAGSESDVDVKEHGRDRMREARQINISLSVLKDCIRGKAEADTLKAGAKMPRIPVRSSILTRVLKHVFDPTGSQICKTVVIACVHPSLADVGPSKNTLRFAEMLRVMIPAAETPDVHETAPVNWTNARLKEWIKENAGTPPILPKMVAPSESGAQMLLLTGTEIEYRCRKCPGVKSEQAKAFRSKLWQMQAEAQYNRERAQKANKTEEAASVEAGNTI